MHFYAFQRARTVILLAQLLEKPAPKKYPKGVEVEGEGELERV